MFLAVGLGMLRFCMEEQRSILREKCPNTDFFSGPYLIVFGLNTEIYYGDLRSKSPYSVRIQVNPDQKKLRI